MIISLEVWRGYFNGGEGNDYILGQNGKDQIFTGNGNDEVFASIGDDTITIDGFGSKIINTVWNRQSQYPDTWCGEFIGV